MKIWVSYPVDVCYVIFYTKKSRVNQNIEMLLMPLFFRQLFRQLFFHPLILICLKTYFFFEMMTYLPVTPITFFFCMADTTFALKRSEESGA